MDNSDLEQKVKQLARRFATSYQEIKSFTAIGVASSSQLLKAAPDMPLKELLEHAKIAIEKEMHARNIASEEDPKTDVAEATTIDNIINQDPSYSDMQTMVIDALRSEYGRTYAAAIKNQTNAKEIIRTIIRTAIEDIAKIHPCEATNTFFHEMELESIIRVFYQNNTWNAINDAYSGKFMPWNYTKVPNHFWSGTEGLERAKNAVHWLVKKRGIKCVEDCRYVSRHHFIEEGLLQMLDRVFASSPYRALKLVFAGLQPWQTMRTTENYFLDHKNRRKALLHYLESNGIHDIENMTPEEVYDTDLRKLIGKKKLEYAGLRALLKQYNGSMYKMCTDILPGKIYPWTINNKDGWKDNPLEKAGEAIRWLFERYLGIPIEEIPDYASNELFWQVGFSGILTNPNWGFNSSTYAAVDNAYPGIFSRDRFEHRKKHVRFKIKYEYDRSNRRR